MYQETFKIWLGLIILHFVYEEDLKPDSRFNKKWMKTSWSNIYIIYISQSCICSTSEIKWLNSNN